MSTPRSGGKRPKIVVSKARLPKPKTVVKLDDVERLNLVVATLEAEKAHERAERLKLERLVVLSKVDPAGRVRALEQAIAECGDKVAAAETRHTEWTAKVKERLGLTTEFSFDSETGVITTEISSEQ